MSRKNVFTLLLTLVLALGVAGAAHASPGKGNQKPKFNGPVKKAVILNDINNHWAEQPVKTMYQYGIILGYPDYSFRPNAPVSKYEAVMMISKASGFKVGKSGNGSSWDGNVPSWMRDCLDYAVENEILTNNEAKNLKGWQPAKRYEAAVWAARAMGLDTDDRLSFRDLNELPAYALPYVGGMYKHRFMVGYPGNNFQPNKPVTRAEMAAILYRILLYEECLDDDDDDECDNSTVRVTKLSPADGARNVDPDTGALKAGFNVDITPVEDLDEVLDGIRVRNVTDDLDLDLEDVTIDGRDLIIELEDSLEKGKSYSVTIDGDILEAEDNGDPFKGLKDGQWEFRVQDSGLEIEDLSPENGDREVVPGIDELTATFSSDIQVVSGKTLLGAVLVYNRSELEWVQVEAVEIDGDTLIITLKDGLAEGNTYEVTIRSGYLEDEDTGEDFDGLPGSSWKFTVED